MVKQANSLRMRASKMVDVKDAPTFKKLPFLFNIYYNFKRFFISSDY